MSLELWLGLLGLLAGVLAFPFGYYIRGLGEKSARLYWDFDDEAIWEPEIPGSEQFNLIHTGGGQPTRAIERARRTVVYLWSAGPGGLKGEELSQIDPLRLSYPPGLNLLTADVLAQVQKANGVVPSIVRDDDGSQSVRFELAFLNAGDGARVEILYEDAREIEAEEGADRSSMRWRRKVEPELLGQIQGNREGFVPSTDAVPRADLLWPLSHVIERLGSACLIVLTVSVAYAILLNPTFLQDGFGFPFVLGVLILGVLCRSFTLLLEKVEERVESRDTRLPPEKIRSESYLRIL